MPEFKPFPKIPRLNRDMVVTEKIDGTNAAIHIVHYTNMNRITDNETGEWTLFDDDAKKAIISGEYVLFVQSRTRFITPQYDNFDFAQWVEDNAAGLVDTLGEGVHFGEWWGRGIQRGYGTKHRYFSLFNVAKWEDADLSAVPGLLTVPVLCRGLFDTNAVNFQIQRLDLLGSFAAPGFDRPEGVIVYHEAANSMFKVMCENDNLPKGLTSE